MKRRETTPLPRRLFPLACTFLALVLLLAAAALPAQAAELYYPKCASSCESLVDALRSVGADASFNNRKAIALCNGVTDYTGTYAQNIRLLNLLKSGTLRRAGSDLGASTTLTENAGKVQYIAQDPKSCKATAVAMAVNLLRGNDICTAAGMGGSCCAGIEGKIYTGSDGLRYSGIYKTDSYTGSEAELESAVASALAAGVPIVAAVHSTAGGTNHHWVVVVGRSGNDYLVVDPAYGSPGTVAANTVTLSSRRYAFGLADYTVPHYGYVTFRAS